VGNYIERTQKTPFLDLNSRMGGDQPAVYVFGVQAKRGGTVVCEDAGIANCSCVEREKFEEEV
jgi:hypothetical protein